MVDLTTSNNNFGTTLTEWGRATIINLATPGHGVLVWIWAILQDYIEAIIAPLRTILDMVVFAPTKYLVQLVTEYIITPSTWLLDTLLLTPLSWTLFTVHSIILRPLYIVASFVSTTLWDYALSHLVHLILYVTYPLVYIFNLVHSWILSPVIQITQFLIDVLFHPVWSAWYLIVDWILRPLVWPPLSYSAWHIINLLSYPLHPISLLTSKILLDPIQSFWTQPGFHHTMLDMLIVGTHAFIHSSYYVVATSFLVGTVHTLTTKFRTRTASKLMFGRERGASLFAIRLLRERHDMESEYVVHIAGLCGTMTTCPHILIMYGGSGALIRQFISRGYQVTVMDSCPLMTQTSLPQEFRLEIEQGQLTIVSDMSQVVACDIVIAHHALSLFPRGSQQQEQLVMWAKCAKRALVVSFVDNEMLDTTEQDGVVCGTYHVTYPLAVSEAIKAMGVGFSQVNVMRREFLVVVVATRPVSNVN